MLLFVDVFAPITRIVVTGQCCDVALRICCVGKKLKIVPVLRSCVGDQLTNLVGQLMSDKGSGKSNLYSNFINVSLPVS